LQEELVSGHSLEGFDEVGSQEEAVSQALLNALERRAAHE
jgi:hypothetical protein